MVGIATDLDRIGLDGDAKDRRRVSNTDEMIIASTLDYSTGRPKCCYRKVVSVKSQRSEA